MKCSKTRKHIPAQQDLPFVVSDLMERLDSLEDMVAKQELNIILLESAYERLNNTKP